MHNTCLSYPPSFSQSLRRRCRSVATRLPAPAQARRFLASRLLTAVLALSFAPVAALAADYYVPGDFNTIQAAIDGTDPGDRIYVLPGTYAGFRYNGNAVTVESLEGPNITIISGSVRFWDGESTDSRLIGFKIIGGDGDLLSFSTGALGTASGYVENCILANSTFKGIAVAGSGAPQIVGVEVYACASGIEVRDSAAPSIEDSHIHDNATRGINVLGSAHPSVYRCRVNENEEEGVYYASPVCGSLDNSIFDHNGDYSGTQASGLVVAQNACVSATNCIFDNNMRDGCELLTGSTASIINCIATNNYRHGISAATGATATITYTCFRNNIQGDLGGSASAGTGCIFTNPRFAHGGDYHLSDPDSPCIDTGDPAIADFALPPGLGGTRSDMGAYGGANNAWPLTLPPPTLLFPSNEATCVSSVVLLDWTSVAGATGYMVEVGSSCGSGTEYLTVASEHEFSGAPNTVYYWRVKTKDSSGGFGNYTGCFSFKTDPGPLAAPVLESPINGATDQPLEGVLEWADVVDAVGYRVQIGMSCGTGDEYDVEASSFAYTGLEAGATYYWRVKTLNECSAYGAYSNCFSFTTENGEPEFVRADVDGSGEVNISDPLYSLAYQFAGGPAPECLDAADSDDSGEVNISDPLYELAYQFAGGTEPPAPFPDCGSDPTTDAIGCESYPPCGPTPRGGSSAPLLLARSAAALERSAPALLGSSTSVTTQSLVRSVPSLAGSSTAPAGAVGNRILLRPAQEVSRDVVLVDLGVETSEELVGFECTVTFDPSVLRFQQLNPLPDVDLDFLSAYGEAGSDMVRVGGVPDLTLASPLQPGVHFAGTLRFQVLRPGALAGQQLEIVSARLVFNDGSALLLDGGDALVLDGGDGCSLAPDSPDAASLTPGTPGSSLSAMPSLRVSSPYRPNGAIMLYLPCESRVEVAVFDVSGRRVRTLFDDSLGSGESLLHWDGSTDDGHGAHTGLYYLNAKVGEIGVRRGILLIE